MKECPISEFEAAILDLVPHGYGRTIVDITRRHYGGNGNKGERSAVSRALRYLWQKKIVVFTRNIYGRTIYRRIM